MDVINETLKKHVLSSDHLYQLISPKKYPCGAVFLNTARALLTRVSQTRSETVFKNASLFIHTNVSRLVKAKLKEPKRILRSDIHIFSSLLHHLNHSLNDMDLPVAEVSRLKSVVCAAVIDMRAARLRKSNKQSTVSKISDALGTNFEHPNERMMDTLLRCRTLLVPKSRQPLIFIPIVKDVIAGAKRNGRLSPECYLKYLLLGKLLILMTNKTELVRIRNEIEKSIKMPKKLRAWAEQQGITWVAENCSDAHQLLHNMTVSLAIKTLYGDDVVPAPTADLADLKPSIKEWKKNNYKMILPESPISHDNSVARESIEDGSRTLPEGLEAKGMKIVLENRLPEAVRKKNARRSERSAGESVQSVLRKKSGKVGKRVIESKTVDSLVEEVEEMEENIPVKKMRRAERNVSERNVENSKLGEGEKSKKKLRKQKKLLHEMEMSYRAEDGNEEMQGNVYVCDEVGKGSSSKVSNTTLHKKRKEATENQDSELPSKKKKMGKKAQVGENYEELKMSVDREKKKKTKKKATKEAGKLVNKDATLKKKEKGSTDRLMEERMTELEMSVTGEDMDVGKKKVEKGEGKKKKNTKGGMKKVKRDTGKVAVKVNKIKKTSIIKKKVKGPEHKKKKNSTSSMSSSIGDNALLTEENIEVPDISIKTKKKKEKKKKDGIRRLSNPEVNNEFINDQSVIPNNTLPTVENIEIPDKSFKSKRKNKEKKKKDGSRTVSDPELSNESMNDKFILPDQISEKNNKKKQKRIKSKDRKSRLSDPELNGESSIDQSVVSNKEHSLKPVQISDKSKKQKKKSKAENGKKRSSDAEFYSEPLIDQSVLSNEEHSNEKNNKKKKKKKSISEESKRRLSDPELNSESLISQSVVPNEEHSLVPDQINAKTNMKTKKKKSKESKGILNKSEQIQEKVVVKSKRKGKGKDSKGGLSESEEMPEKTSVKTKKKGKLEESRETLNQSEEMPGKISVKSKRKGKSKESKGRLSESKEIPNQISHDDQLVAGKSAQISAKSVYVRKSKAIKESVKVIKASKENEKESKASKKRMRESHAVEEVGRRNLKGRQFDVWDESEESDIENLEIKAESESESEGDSYAVKVEIMKEEYDSENEGDEMKILTHLSMKQESESDDDDDETKEIMSQLSLKDDTETDDSDDDDEGTSIPTKNEMESDDSEGKVSMADIVKVLKMESDSEEENETNHNYSMKSELESESDAESYVLFEMEPDKKINSARRTIAEEEDSDEEDQEIDDDDDDLLPDIDIDVEDELVELEIMGDEKRDEEEESTHGGDGKEDRDDDGEENRDVDGKEDRGVDDGEEDTDDDASKEEKDKGLEMSGDAERDESDSSGDEEEEELEREGGDAKDSLGGNKPLIEQKKHTLPLIRESNDITCLMDISEKENSNVDKTHKPNNSIEIVYEDSTLDENIKTLDSQPSSHDLRSLGERKEKPGKALMHILPEKNTRNLSKNEPDSGLVKNKTFEGGPLLKDTLGLVRDDDGRGKALLEIDMSEGSFGRAVSEGKIKGFINTKSLKQNGSYQNADDSDSDLEIISEKKATPPMKRRRKHRDWSDIDEASGSEDDIVPCDDKTKMFTDEETQAYHKKLKAAEIQRKVEIIIKQEEEVLKSRMKNGKKERDSTQKGKKKKKSKAKVQKNVKKPDGNLVNRIFNNLYKSSPSVVKGNRDKEIEISNETCKIIKEVNKSREPENSTSSNDIQDVSRESEEEDVRNDEACQSPSDAVDICDPPFLSMNVAEDEPLDEPISNSGSEKDIEIVLQTIVKDTGRKASIQGLREILLNDLNIKRELVEGEEKKEPKDTDGARHSSLGDKKDLNAPDHQESNGDNAGDSKGVEDRESLQNEKEDKPEDESENSQKKKDSPENEDKDSKNEVDNSETKDSLNEKEDSVNIMGSPQNEKEDPKNEKGESENCSQINMEQEESSYLSFGCDEEQTEDSVNTCAEFDTPDPVTLGKDTSKDTVKTINSTAVSNTDREKEGEQMEDSRTVGDEMNTPKSDRRKEIDVFNPDREKEIEDVNADRGKEIEDVNTDRGKEIEDDDVDREKEIEDVDTDREEEIEDVDADREEEIDVNSDREEEIDVVDTELDIEDEDTVDHLREITCKESNGASTLITDKENALEKISAGIESAANIGRIDEENYLEKDSCGKENVVEKVSGKENVVEKVSGKENVVEKDSCGKRDDVENGSAKENDVENDGAKENDVESDSGKENDDVEDSNEEEDAVEKDSHNKEYAEDEDEDDDAEVLPSGEENEDDMSEEVRKVEDIEEKRLDDDIIGTENATERSDENEGDDSESEDDDEKKMANEDDELDSEDEETVTKEDGGKAENEKTRTVVSPELDSNIETMMTDEEGEEDEMTDEGEDDEMTDEGDEVTIKEDEGKAEDKNKENNVEPNEEGDDSDSGDDNTMTNEDEEEKTEDRTKEDELSLKMDLVFDEILKGNVSPSVEKCRNQDISKFMLKETDKDDKTCKATSDYRREKAGSAILSPSKKTISGLKPVETHTDNCNINAPETALFNTGDIGKVCSEIATKITPDSDNTSPSKVCSESTKYIHDSDKHSTDKAAGVKSVEEESNDYVVMKKTGVDSNEESEEKMMMEGGDEAYEAGSDASEDPTPKVRRRTRSMRKSCVPCELKEASDSDVSPVRKRRRRKTLEGTEMNSLTSQKSPNSSLAQGLEATGSENTNISPNDKAVNRSDDSNSDTADKKHSEGSPDSFNSTRQTAASSGEILHKRFKGKQALISNYLMPYQSPKPEFLCDDQVAETGINEENSEVNLADNELNLKSKSKGISGNNKLSLDMVDSKQLREEVKDKEKDDENDDDDDEEEEEEKFVEDHDGESCYKEGSDNKNRVEMTCGIETDENRAENIDDIQPTEYLDEEEGEELEVLSTSGLEGNDEVYPNDSLRLSSDCSLREAGSRVSPKMPTYSLGRLSRTKGDKKDSLDSSKRESLLLPAIPHLKAHCVSKTVLTKELIISPEVSDEECELMSPAASDDLEMGGSSEGPLERSEVHKKQLSLNTQGRGARRNSGGIRSPQKMIPEEQDESTPHKKSSRTMAKALKSPLACNSPQEKSKARSHGTYGSPGKGSSPRKQPKATNSIGVCDLGPDFEAESLRKSLRGSKAEGNSLLESPTQNSPSKSGRYSSDKSEEAESLRKSSLRGNKSEGNSLMESPTQSSPSKSGKLSADKAFETMVALSSELRVNLEALNDATAASKSFRATRSRRQKERESESTVTDSELEKESETEETLPKTAVSQSPRTTRGSRRKSESSLTDSESEKESETEGALPRTSTEEEAPCESKENSTPKNSTPFKVQVSAIVRSPTMKNIAQINTQSKISPSEECGRKFSPLEECGRKNDSPDGVVGAGSLSSKSTPSPVRRSARLRARSMTPTKTERSGRRKSFSLTPVRASSRIQARLAKETIPEHSESPESANYNTPIKTTPSRTVSGTPTTLQMRTRRQGRRTISEGCCGASEGDFLGSYPSHGDLKEGGTPGAETKALRVRLMQLKKYS